MLAATSASSLLSVIRGIASITKWGASNEGVLMKYRASKTVKKGQLSPSPNPLWPSGTTPLSISMIRIYDLGEAADIAINSTFC